VPSVIAPSSLLLFWLSGAC